MLELEAERGERKEQEGSPAKSLITTKGLMHCLMMSSGEYPELMGPGCVILGGTQD